MPETSLPGTSCPGLPAASQKLAPTVFGESVLSRGEGFGLAVGGEMLKLAKGQRGARLLAAAWQTITGRERLLGASEPTCARATTQRPATRLAMIAC